VASQRARAAARAAYGSRQLALPLEAAPPAPAVPYAPPAAALQPEPPRGAGLLPAAAVAVAAGVGVLLLCRALMRASEARDDDEDGDEA
jgi:hypothetical protein